MYFYGCSKNSIELKPNADTREVVLFQYYSNYTLLTSLCILNICTAHLYADDCQLHLSSYDPSSVCETITHINSDLENISKWFIGYGLKVNLGKCTALHVIPHNLVQALMGRGVVITLYDEFLAMCDQVKVLGIMLNHLTFGD
ncbi:hypothetical protein J6590_041023 [Homalodisca vitripennis]|nr:hypothetical protein J6590_041023 [Homalodisca vitripennis]